MDSAARQDDIDVLVVGAGPTGLMLANWLAELGVSSAIIDGDDGPMSESRALGVHSRSMEIYDQLGVVDRVLAEAVRAESMRQCFGRTAFAPIPLTGLGQGITPYPAMYMLEQSANERILTDNLGALGGTVRWRHRLTALDRHDDGVVVPVDTPSDRSAIRASPGLRQHPPGHHRIPPRLSHARGWRGTERAAPHRHRRGRRRLQGDGGLRAAPPRGRLRRCVRGPPLVLHLQGPPSDRGAVPLGGSVFLAGDAAHVHSPVGAQGMNTGLQDAHNLAFKLHDVVVGRAPAALLDRYEIERRPVAQRLLRTTDTLFLGITTRSPLAGLVRKYVPRAALPFGVAILPHLPIGRRLAGHIGQIRTHYRMEARSGHRPRGSRLHRTPSSDAACSGQGGTSTR